MKETTIENLVELAKKFNQEGKKWHFHMLTPDCVFNKRKDKYAFVLENDTDRETHTVYSYKRHMGMGEELAKLLYGKAILEQEPHPTPPGKGMKSILEKAAQMTKEDRPWHHHILFPECIFNKHNGKWTIIFEESEEGKAMESVTSHEPRDDVKKMEILYYSQKR
jgi:hypothetical protein